MSDAKLKALAGFLFLLPAAAGGDSVWPVYGGDPGGQKHAPLTEINRNNVESLGDYVVAFTLPE